MEFDILNLLFKEIVTYGKPIFSNNDISTLLAYYQNNKEEPNKKKELKQTVFMELVENMGLISPLKIEGNNH